MLQLNHIELATEEDKANNLVYWAKLFNASTWEEFKLLAADRPEVKEVGTLIFTLNTDDQTAELLEAQRRYREMMASEYAAGVMDTEEKLNIVIADQAAEIANKDSTIAEQADIISKFQAEIDALKNKK